MTETELRAIGALAIIGLKTAVAEQDALSNEPVRIFEGICQLASGTKARATYQIAPSQSSSAPFGRSRCATQR